VSNSGGRARLRARAESLVTYSLVRYRAGRRRSREGRRRRASGRGRYRRVQKCFSIILVHRLASGGLELDTRGRTHSTNDCAPAANGSAPFMTRPGEWPDGSFYLGMVTSACFKRLLREYKRIAIRLARDIYYETTTASQRPLVQKYGPSLHRTRPPNLLKQISVPETCLSSHIGSTLHFASTLPILPY
jgi:hypothetical protein